jgi:hypothetical protein
VSIDALAPLPAATRIYSADAKRVIVGASSRVIQMPERPMRLGDVVDDYCSRCKLLLDHAVQALAGEEIQTVVCKTCMHTHPYRHARGGRKKSGKLSLFDQILAKKPPTSIISMPTTKKPSGGGDEE